MAVQITCIKKAGGYHEDPHVAITELGWANDVDGKTGRSTRLEMHKFVSEGGVAYVKDSYGQTAKLVAKVSRTGNPYVQTIADGMLSDNLLKQPECRP